MCLIVHSCESIRESEPTISKLLNLEKKLIVTLDNPRGFWYQKQAVNNNNNKTETNPKIQRKKAPKPKATIYMIPYSLIVHDIYVYGQSRAGHKRK